MHTVGDFKMNKEDIIKALAEIRKQTKERKFEQSVDLIINLRKFDIKKHAINEVINVPHKIKDKKVCGFLTKKHDSVNTITKPEFAKYKDAKELKKLVKKYDYFIAHASLMPAVATTFGKVLGPAGKMPSPKLGILMTEDEKALSDLLNKINSAIKIRTIEPTIKIIIGKEKMSDEELAENILSAHKVVLKALPLGKENIRSVMIKLTMGHPVKVGVKKQGE